MRYRKIDDRIWADAKFRALSDNAKLLWLYLLTGPQTTSLPGVIVAGRAQLAECLGWKQHTFDEAFGEVSRKGMAKGSWKDRLILLPNALRYNRPDSPNVIKSWRSHWESVPECALKTEAWRAFMTFAEGLPEGYRDAFGYSLGKGMPNQDQDQDQDQEQEQEQEQEGCRGGEAPIPPTQETKPEGQKPGKRSLPQDWKPNKACTDRAMALDFGPRAYAQELANFRDKCAADAWTAVDWDAKFRTWLTNAVKFNNGRSPYVPGDDWPIEPVPEHKRKPPPPEKRNPNLKPIVIPGIVGNRFVEDA